MPEKSHALIIGCGFLGVRVAESLQSRGWVVTGTTRTRTRFGELEHSGIFAAELDVAKADGNPLWRERYDAIIYSVAPGRGGNPAVVFGQGTRAVAENLRSTAPRRFLLVSSTGVYSTTDGGEVDETSPAEPREERPRHIRGAEQELLTPESQDHLPASVLRLGGLYGPGRSPLEWLERPGLRDRLVSRSAKAWMNWIRVEDAAAAVALAAESARAGEIYDIVDGTPVRREDFFRLAAELVGVEPASFVSDATDLGKRLSGAKARRELGFEPRFPSYREGLTDLG